MKRLWIAIAILLLLCGAALANVYFLTRFTADLSSSLIQAQQAVEQGDWEQAVSITGQTGRKFQDKDFYLHVTLRHDDIDAIGIAFRELLELLEHRERVGEYAAANARLIAKLELLAESENLSLHNIL